MPAALSDTQNRYLALAWLCVDVDPKINFEKFSQLTGSKTAASAREMLRVAKKKLQEFDTTASTTDGTTAPPNTPAAKTPRKKATTKTKSTNKGKATKKRKVASDSDGSEDDEETPIKKKTVVKAEPADEDSDAGIGAGADSDDAEV
ncbi:hypothetical protein E4T44_05623 [Aureobasidium sp. EXF-8845]|nr:hypothetical protein E4T44_05623 [Aureobasidium sp. EXF-8845]KAI4849247.1 hypothetical protein E4T45_05990 [Aureobasidium sp. EXF-8846]